MQKNFIWGIFTISPPYSQHGGLMEIEILNWANYNKRNDYRRPYWFALSNRLVEDPDFFEFSAEEFKAWIYILSIASQKNSAKIKINFIHAEKVSNIKKKTILSALNHLEKIKAVQILYETCTDPVQNPNATIQYNTIHNITEHNNTLCTVGSEDPPMPKELDFNILVSDNIKKRWLELYPDQEFIKREMLKAKNWCEINPIKKPRTEKGWSRFLSSWLEKGWVNHIKTKASNKINDSESYKKSLMEKLK